MLVGVRCSWLTGEEQCIPTQQCLACAGTGNNPCGYPLPFLKVMTRERDPKKVSCSSTMLSGCPREHGLKKERPWYIHPDRGYTRAYGSLMHLGCETMEKQHQDTSSSIEERFGRTIVLHDGREIRVTAQLDAMYLTGATARIKDYKVVDTLSDSAIRRKAASYLPQFSTQRWILAERGIEVASVDLLFLHQKSRRVVNLWPFGEEEFPEALLWSLEKTEDYLQSRLPELVDSLAGTLSPPLVDPQETWRCTYCDVRAECEQEYGRPLPAFTHK